MDPLELLWQAYHSTYGIEIEVKGNFLSSMQNLYKARRSDPELECVSIHRSVDNPTTHLWLCPNHFLKKSPETVVPLDDVEEELHRLLGNDDGSET